jgi:formate C-acetyltransferase
MKGFGMQALPERIEGHDFVAAEREMSVRRLPDTTRELAALALSGAHGRSMASADFSIDPDFYLSLPSPNRICAEAVRLIGANAPLRILPGERIVGSATLKSAMEHKIPLTQYRSVSHTTIGFEKALRIGYRGLRAEVEERLAGGVDGDGRDLLEAMLVSITAAGEWRRRHVEYLEELIGKSEGGARKNYEDVLAALRNVPENPPGNFREALQALWFLWCFQRLCGNWSGIGRFDKMMGPFLHRDLSEGRLTLDDARDLIAHFWIKGCEWVRGDDAYQYGVFPVCRTWRTVSWLLKSWSSRKNRSLLPALLM